LVAPLWILLGTALGLYGLTTVSAYAAILWSVGSFGLAAFTWRASVAQTRRSDRQKQELYAMLAVIVQAGRVHELSTTKTTLSTLSEQGITLAGEILTMLVESYKGKPDIEPMEFLFNANPTDGYTAFLKGQVLDQYFDQFASRVHDFLNQIGSQDMLMRHTADFYLRPTTIENILYCGNEIADAIRRLHGVADISDVPRYAAKT